MRDTSSAISGPEQGFDWRGVMYAIALTVRGGESGRCVRHRQQDLRRDEKGLEKEETSRDREASGGVRRASRGRKCTIPIPYQDFT